VSVHVHPRARRNALDLSPSGTLKAAVTAAPEDGKATAAVIALLAGAWRLPKSAISLKQGAASRDKVFSVSGDAETVTARIDAWMKENV
jgi:uncharacterized protein YggU (UPF0235/DUF167 family)